jgi:hypothetical protein
MKKTTLLKTVICLLPWLLPVQCGQKAVEPGSVVAPAPKDALFERVAPDASGVDFANNITETHQNTVLTNSYLYNGGGVGVIDFNNDGLQDLFFVSTQGSCKLYQNLGNFKFKDVTEKAGVQAAEGDKTGVTVVDINADGWQDIYVCRTGMVANDARRNLLFINNHDGTFTEKAHAYGLDDAGASNHANFFDADGDGDLDCYVLNYPIDFKTVNSARVADRGDGTPVRITEPTDPGNSDHLYQNNGDGTFTNISKKAGFNDLAFGLSVTASDLNNDGFQDLMIGNDYIEPDFVYINNPAQPGNFTDHYRDYFRHSSNHTMGVDIADINNDGLPDIIALDMLAEDYSRQKQLMTTMLSDRYSTLVKYGYGHQNMRNVLQLNNGNGSFSEIGCLAGVFQTDWSWAPLLEDFDNDGFRDLFITNGYRRDVSNLDYLMFTSDSIQRTGGLTAARFPKIKDYLDLIPSTPIPNYCYRNKGDLTFENVSTPWGLVERTYSNGAVYADLDNDGDMDLVINNIDHPAYIYRNKAVESGKGGAWVQIKPIGSEKNPFATGARARVQVGDHSYYEELTPTRGFLSSVEPIFHFGLGQAQTIDKIEIEFPGQQLAVLEHLAPNKRYIVKYTDAKPGKLSVTPGPAPRLKEIAGPDFVHRQEVVEDFNRERLLPWKMSTPGPCLAVGDVNGDHLDDFYVGNAAGAAGALYIQKPGGGFQATSTATWEADKNFEDTGAVLFDADGDGDLDLFVASGGNSFNANDINYQPRLYLNDGHGNFTRSKNALPPITSSGYAVTAYDFDHDGDLDIMVGGWCTPLAYPAAPNSYILQNDKGVFQDVTDGYAPQFRKIGMVRSIVWADLDGDKKDEMIVTGEWMPLQVFTWQGGRLKLATEQFGLAGSEGFWHALAAVDIDGDGDMDLVAGNLGLNTRYKASPESPLRLYAKDFDNNGSMDPIMTQMDNGKEVPVALHDLMLKQIPMLKKKFIRYAPYATAAVTDLFPEKDLQAAIQLKCNYLASGVWINNGGKFTMKALPNEAQFAPVYGIQVLEGPKPGLLLAGNDYGQQVETGRCDAGNGLLLNNDGKGNLKGIPGRASGFWATKEARDLKILRGPGGKRLVVVANNNDKLQVFELGEKAEQ